MAFTVFAGTVDDPFYIDLGAAFDSLNFRVGAGGGVLTALQDAEDNVNTAPDFVSGYNVNTIAIEVPISMLTRTGTKVAATNPAATIGAWGATYRPRITVRRAPLDPVSSGSFSQVQRMGNPLINELIIGTGSKDYWSMSQPKDDSQFATFRSGSFIGASASTRFTESTFRRRLAPTSCRWSRTRPRSPRQEPRKGRLLTCCGSTPG